MLIDALKWGDKLAHTVDNRKQINY